MACKEMWNEVPKPIQIIVYSILGAIAAVFFGLLFGIIIRELWNWLMPMIFGLPTITFWQGAGLFILAKILFGGVSSHSDSSKSSKKNKKEWNAENWGKKMENWQHYDAWWKTEGKEAFAQFASNAQEEPVPAETVADEPAEETHPKPDSE